MASTQGRNQTLVMPIKLPDPNCVKLRYRHMLSCDDSEPPENKGFRQEFKKATEQDVLAYESMY